MLQNKREPNVQPKVPGGPAAARRHLLASRPPVDFCQIEHVLSVVAPKLLCFGEAAKVASEITVVQPMNNKCCVVGFQEVT